MGFSAQRTHLEEKRFCLFFFFLRKCVIVKSFSRFLHVHMKSSFFGKETDAMSSHAPAWAQKKQGSRNSDSWKCVPSWRQPNGMKNNNILRNTKTCSVRKKERMKGKEKSKMRVSTKRRFLAAIGFWQIMAAVRIFFVVIRQCTKSLRRLSIVSALLLTDR